MFLDHLQVRQGRHVSVVAVSVIILTTVVACQASAQQTAPPVNLQGDTSQAPSAQTVRIIQAMINWDHAPATPINPQGIHLCFVQFDKRKVGGHNMVVYRGYAPGVATDQQYALITWPIGGQMQIVANQVWINNHGLLMCAQPTKEEQNADSVSEKDEIDFVVEAGKGEPKRFALVSQDPKLVIPGTLVPYPLEAKDKACSMQALLAGPHGEAFILEGSGFAPQAEVKLDSVSAGEHQTGTFHSSPTGQLTTTILPFVEGKDHGVAEVHLSAPDCNLSLKLPWGKDSYHVE